MVVATQLFGFPDIGFGQPSMDRLGALATSGSADTASSSRAFDVGTREKLIADATDVDINLNLLISTFSAFYRQWWKKYDVFYEISK